MLQTYLYVAMAIFGLLSFCAAFVSYRRTRVFLRTAVPATGTITQVVEDRDDSTGYSYTPHYSFQAPDGRSWSGSFSVTSDRYGYKPGATIPILYDPANPSESSVHKPAQLWGPSIGFGAIGVMLIAVACWLLRTVH